MTRSSTLEWVVGQSLPKKSRRRRSKSPRRRTIVHVETSDEDFSDSGYSQSSVDEVHVTRKREKKVHFIDTPKRAAGVCKGACCAGSQAENKPAADKGPMKKDEKKACCAAREAATVAVTKAADARKAESEKSKEENKKPPKPEHTCGLSQSKESTSKVDKIPQHICKSCQDKGGSKKKDDPQSNACCSQCGDMKKSEKGGNKSDNGGKGSGMWTNGAKSSKPHKQQNSAQAQNKANASQPNRMNTTTRNGKMVQRVLQPSRGDVVLREDVIECQSDPRPNAFFDIKTGVLRVYHGPIYGNPFARLVPLSSTMMPHSIPSGGIGGPLSQQHHESNNQSKPTPPQKTDQAKPADPNSDLVEVLANLMSKLMANANGKNNNNTANSETWGASDNTSNQSNANPNSSDDWGNSTTDQAANQTQGGQGSSGDGWGAQTTGDNATLWGADNNNHDSSSGWPTESGNNDTGDASNQSGWPNGQSNSDNQNLGWGDNTTTNQESWGGNNKSSSQAQQQSQNSWGQNNTDLNNLNGQPQGNSNSGQQGIWGSNNTPIQQNNQNTWGHNNNNSNNSNGPPPGGSRFGSMLQTTPLQQNANQNNQATPWQPPGNPWDPSGGGNGSQQQNGGGWNGQGQNNVPMNNNFAGNSGGWNNNQGQSGNGAGWSGGNQNQSQSNINSSVGWGAGTGNNWNTSSNNTTSGGDSGW